jgi:hypothetical protein
MPKATITRLKALESALDERTASMRWMMQSKGLSTLLKLGHTPGHAPAPGYEGPLSALLMQPWPPPGDAQPIFDSELFMASLSARLKALESKTAQMTDSQRLARQHIGM